MKKTLVFPLVACTVFGTVAAVAPASADPLPYGPNTCINGFVWRNARDGDAVCVTPATRDQVAAENADPGAHKDPNGAYGPQSCAQGYVWRQAFDGDTICVTPEIRTQTLADNAAASSRMAANQPAPPPAESPGSPRPQSGPPGSASVILEATGAGTALTIDLYDPNAEPRLYNVALPYSRSVAAAPQSGQLYQIVAIGKDTAKPGCRITVNGQEVAQQPEGGSGQCIYTAP